MTQAYKIITGVEKVNKEVLLFTPSCNIRTKSHLKKLIGSKFQSSTGKLAQSACGPHSQGMFGRPKLYPVLFLTLLISWRIGPSMPIGQYGQGHGPVR